MVVEKVTFTLPEELVRRLEEVPAGKRSMLVKQAVERELDRQAAVATLRGLQTKQIWKERNHPNLRTPKDLGQYRAIKSRLGK